MCVQIAANAHRMTPKWRWDKIKVVSFEMCWFLQEGINLKVIGLRSWSHLVPPFIAHFYSHSVCSFQTMVNCGKVQAIQMLTRRFFFNPPVFSCILQAGTFFITVSQFRFSLFCASRFWVLSTADLHVTYSTFCSFLLLEFVTSP